MNVTAEEMKSQDGRIGINGLEVQIQMARVDIVDYRHKSRTEVLWKQYLSHGRKVCRTVGGVKKIVKRYVLCERNVVCLKFES